MQRLVQLFPFLQCLVKDLLINRSNSSQVKKKIIIIKKEVNVNISNRTADAKMMTLKKQALRGHRITRKKGSKEAK